MKYSVVVRRNHEVVIEIPNCSERQAEKYAAEQASKNPTCQVFVTWYRSSDGQHGYLNRGEGHAITGRAW